MKDENVSLLHNENIWSNKSNEKLRIYFIFLISSHQLKLNDVKI